MVGVTEFIIWIQPFVSVGDPGFTEQFLPGLLDVGFSFKDGLLLADLAHRLLDLHDGLGHESFLDLVHGRLETIVVIFPPFIT